MSSNKKIDEWQKEGLISLEQSKKLKSYEEQKKDYNWILNGILIVAASAIGFGVISLIASNWYKIPDSLKLGFNFTWILFLVACIYKNYVSKANYKLLFLKGSNHNVQEALLFLFLISCMATIGLIAQIYHTGGVWYQALFLWSFIVFLTVLVSKGFVVPSFWAIIFMISSYNMLIHSGFMSPITQKDDMLFAWPGLCYLTSYLFSKLKPLPSIKSLSNVFMKISLTLFLYSLFVMDMEMKILGLKGGSKEVLIAICISCFLAFIIALYAEKKTKKILLCYYLIIPFLYMIRVFSEKSNVFLEFIGGLSLMMLLTLFALHFGYQKRRVFFNFFIFLISLRLFAFYFQALGGFATTGVGLILSGVLILLLLFLFRKFPLYAYFQKRTDQ